MATGLSPDLHEFVLDFIDEASEQAEDPCKKACTNVLFNDLLIEHIFWFCRFRWIAIAVLLLFGTLSNVPGLFDHLRLQTDLRWPFSIAVIAAILNTIFVTHANRLRSADPGRGLLINMWSQILLDLILLTVVVHFFGSLDTVIPFAYLFHIVLSCIFFTRLQSLFVIVFSSYLFMTCVALESSGMLSVSSIFSNPSLTDKSIPNQWMIVMHVAMILAIWFVVWYLVSYISNLVRVRDYELCTTNQRLKEAQEEKSKHLLRLTHELKAPFAAIDANIQVIQKGHCGVLPAKAMELLERISARSRKLGDVIQVMLQLANLRKMSTETTRMEAYDLAEIIRWCIGQLQPAAEKQGVKIDTELQSVQVNANEDCLKMLFLNLISNAIIYSHYDGDVKVVCRAGAGGGAAVSVEDHGIGIKAEKINKIFDEYYRTDEAVLHNKNSNGLGLAIVKHVAQTHRLAVRVASAPDIGTRFEIQFPAEQSQAA